MKITYIHHSAFLTELENSVLLFDYYKGKIPDIAKEKTLYVFASHAHPDHFSKKIFEIGEGHPDVYFILSDDIAKKSVPNKWMNRVIFVKEAQKLVVGALEIETFHSTDEGVAFWILAEENTIYYAGDLNNWYWEGESEEWNKTISEDYRKEIEKMSQKMADVSFLVLDPRQKNQYYLGMNDFMKKVKTRYIVPMHFWGDYSIIEKMKHSEYARDYQDKIIEIDREGQSFYVPEGKEK